MNPTKRLRTRAGLFVIALTAVLATAALALITGDHNQPVATDTVLPPGHAGMKAYQNPETGELEVTSRPIAELDTATRNALRRDDTGLKPVYHANGMVSVNLDGRYQHASMAYEGKDGVVVSCTHTHEGADAALCGKHTTPEAEVE